MAIIDRMQAALRDRDAEAYLALYDDGAVFVRHQSGTEMSKAQFAELIRRMMASDAMTMGERRLIYENDDILVTHAVNDYPDGSREAVLMAMTLKDGRVVRVETGATPLDR